MKYLKRISKFICENNLNIFLFLPIVYYGYTDFQMKGKILRYESPIKVTYITESFLGYKGQVSFSGDSFDKPRYFYQILK